MVMTVSSSPPHGDVGPLSCKQYRSLWSAGLWGCGQRVSVVHQIPSLILLPYERRLGVAACSLGRDHAPQRIDLYPAGTIHPQTTIDIHVSREPESCGGDQTTTG